MTIETLLARAEKAWAKLDQHLLDHGPLAERVATLRESHHVFTAEGIPHATEELTREELRFRQAYQVGEALCQTAIDLTRELAANYDALTDRVAKVLACCVIGEDASTHDDEPESYPAEPTLSVVSTAPSAN